MTTGTALSKYARRARAGELRYGIAKMAVRYGQAESRCTSPNVVSDPVLYGRWLRASERRYRALLRLTDALEALAAL
jgi:hypothetical protein